MFASGDTKGINNSNQNLDSKPTYETPKELVSIQGFVSIFPIGWKDYDEAHQPTRAITLMRTNSCTPLDSKTDIQ
jgi:hypothetical protein